MYLTEHDQAGRYPLQYIIWAGCQEDADARAEFRSGSRWNFRKLHSVYGIRSAIRCAENEGTCDCEIGAAFAKKARAWARRNSL